MDVSRRDLLITTAATGTVATLGPELVGSAQAASAGAWSGPATAPADAGPAPGSDLGTTLIIPGRCHECHPQCPLLVHVRAGRVVKVEGDPKGPNRGALCAKGQATVKNLYSPERLNYPMKRTRPKGEARSRMGADFLGRGAGHHRRPAERDQGAVRRALRSPWDRARDATPSILFPG